MAERPIIFSGPMVRAIIEGRKTQTRRVVRGMPAAPAADCHPSHVARHTTPYFDAYCGARKSPENPRGMSGSWCWWQVDDRQCLPTIRCPFGVPGDVLWVREKWQRGEDFEVSDAKHGRHPERWRVYYGANDNGFSGRPWRPSIHMPRWASRIRLHVEAVRVQRVQEITEEEAIAEGMVYFDGRNYEAGGWHPGDTRRGYWPDAQSAFSSQWDIDNKRHPWASNPWVWVVEFEKEADRG